MDAGHNIYEIDEITNMMNADDLQTMKEDLARLDGFLKGRSESDRKRHEKVVWDSKTKGTYRKSEHGRIGT